jgi:Flp pilus assembly protein TadD
MKSAIGFVGAIVLAAAVGCGGGGEQKKVETGGVGGIKPVVTEQPGGAPVSKEAADAFTSAVNEFKTYEDQRSWDDAKCDAVSKKFLAAGAAQGGHFPAAHYNAGITLLRCGREADAEREFDIALQEKSAMGAKDPVFHQVWVQKAMIRYRKGDLPGITEAINTIFEKGFDPDGAQNVEAFVSLGVLYRERWNKDAKNPETRKRDKFDLEDDLARAQFWLQNALAINDAFMPAYNQLALFYLDKARAVTEKKAKSPKAKAGKKDDEKDKRESTAKADLQTLELGLLVSEEASRRDPGYAGIWNTQGLILLEMGRTGAATKAFQKATEKDAKFFEAWMNYAAINLQFRGYGEAAKGYEQAAGIRPKDYDAKLGLAVALRGQLDFHLTTKQEIERALSECTDQEYAARFAKKCASASSEGPAKLKEHEGKFLDFYKRAQAAYDSAREVDPGRPEAYFNKALLVEKYKAKAETSVTTAVAYREAEKLYGELASKFAGQPQYAKLVADAKDRGEEARKSAEFEEKAMAAPPPAAPAPAPAAGAAPAAGGTAAAGKP